MNFKVFTPFDPASIPEKDKIVDFLHKHLDEYGDPREDIMKCIQYAQKESASHGGYIVTGLIDDEIVGAVVINRTGMEGYIPENILVYIAVDNQHRGKGIGKQLMQKAISLAQGDIALHVEPDNPARHLYTKLGFTNKYLEMRLKQAGA
ncbi:GNAT family N-acetyltransferase [Phaeodactylibacter luteus]|uniref:GNAT family N-acetyltransferase n=1 Tax=Phaeodactylibacter luteus TaxID=1564516 RepID=A0A5C6RYF0_9BACT|nr:GNAT family N-acetyltransferase [Phaeodactylibacter luteus]TXB67636.1 GNAT family N-acetyltransferase [Phaeodactylibacter luteus]